MYRWGVINLYKKIENFISDKTRVKYDEPMMNHTSFKVGGKADCFVVVNSEMELIQILKYLKENNIQFFIMGNGSNLLVSDNGIRGVVIKLGDEFKKFFCDGNYITVGASCSMNALAQEALSNSLTGFEWAFGIPGSVGGAVFMNAGAYGGSMEDVIEKTIYLDEEFNICTLDKEGHNFGYRRSSFKSGEIKGIILKSVIKLQEGKKEEIWANMQKYIGARIDKQPLNMPSAGSVFKRPDGHYVGKMIEELGLKGFSIGGAQVSKKHAGFIVNKCNATSKDIKELIKYIKNKVKEEYDVELETEILEVGEE